MKLNKEILHLAVPNIISNLSVPLLSSVDTALVGHLPQSYFIGAVAVGGMIFNFIYWGFGFLRMGTTGLTAQAEGRKNVRETRLILARALWVAFIAGMVLLLLQQPIASVSFYLISAAPEVERYARSYFLIRILAAPATLTLYTVQGWFLGKQNARYPLLLVLSVNLLNLLFDLLFVLGFKMNSDGVALGTVCAQYLGLFLGGCLLWHFQPNWWRGLKRKQIWYWPAVQRFFLLNRDIFIRTLSLILVFSFFTAKSAEFSDTVLAANTILIQLWMLFSYGIDGFAFAAESLAGKYKGAGDTRRFKKVIRHILGWGVSLGVLYSVIYSLFDRLIIILFTNQPQVIFTALSFMGWTYIAPIVNSISYIWDGVYIGATASKEMRNTMLLATFGFFLPAFYLTRGYLANNSLWLAITLFMIVRGCSLSLLAGRALLPGTHK